MCANLYTLDAVGVAYQKITNITDGQDGVLYGGYVFRFTTSGTAAVHRLGEKAPFATFELDKKALLCPHSNAVFFGQERMAEDDEFPLLYTNVYNTYAKEADRHEGTCCVYRLIRTGEVFATKLVQVIRVGFAGTALWRSAHREDVRPYGNFAAEGDRLYAFTMRDEEHVTRLFAFRLPKAGEGDYDATLDARAVTLTEADVLAHFDVPYMNYMQGACCHGGYLYSVEGFSHSKEAPPCLRVIDICKKKQVFSVDLLENGLPVEPEMIDVYDGKLYYGDGTNALYVLTFVK